MPELVARRGRSAFGLAEQLRIGSIGTKVYKKRGQFGGWVTWAGRTGA